ncbi:MAG: restriction endonuclease subunit S [Nitrospira sp.]|nr:restriction endonuclease subunit S [Nitrospira sp.]
MKGGWQMKTLDQIALNLDSKRIPITKSARVSGKYPYYGASGIVDYVTDYIFEGDTLLVSEDGANLLARSTPIAFPASGKYWVNNHAHILKFDDMTTQRFVELYLDSIPLDEYVTGAAQPKLNQQALNSIPIPLPSLSEQQRIVGILDEAFEGIAIAKANAEKNLHNARALFESHLQSVFTQRGNGWVEKKLRDVCAITSVLVDPRKKEFLDLIHVGAGNIESQTGVFIDLKTARKEALISGKFIFDEKMVLYSKIRPYLMKVARPDFRGLCSADMYPLAPIPDQITRDYLFHLLLNKDFTDYAIQGSARAGMPKVNREHLFEFKFWLPDLKTQKQLADDLDSLAAETQRLSSIYQQKLAALDELKKSLLHQAFSGEL